MYAADQILQALLQQQMQPMQVEVDEMTKGQQTIADEMAELQRMGENPQFKTGLAAMSEAQRVLQQGRKKDKDSSDDYYGGATVPY